ncbi:MAG: DUF4340 domain-containing protein [Kiritimatiellae bacterium]|nr:DUF4340 domain-containing protein [Kiritimatiellia bacterium]
MKGKNLLALVILAVIVIAVAVLTSRQPGSPTAKAVGTHILPSLDVNKVANIVVRSHQETATVARAEDVWVCPAKFGYPADFEKVKRVLLKLADLKVADTTQLDDAQRKQLKMYPPGTEGIPSENTGTMVELKDRDGTPLAVLLLGEEHRRRPSGERVSPYDSYPDGRFVSADQGKTVYVVSDVLDDLSPRIGSWLDTELLNVASADIKEITLTSTNGHVVKLARMKEGGSLEVTDLAEDEETDSSKLYSVQSALSYLRFDDVADPSLTDEQLGMGKPAFYEAVTKDGERYRVTVGGKPEGKDERYIRIAVTLDPAPEQPAKSEEKKEETASQGEEKKKEDEGKEKEKQEARKKLEEKVASLNKKVGKWTYTVSAYKAESFTRGRSDLVKKKEKKEEKQEQKETGASSEADSKSKASGT